MVYGVDFIHEYTEDIDERAQALVKSLFVDEVKDNKPCIVLLAGDSGTGKSHDSLMFVKRILKCEGLELKDYINDIYVYTPLEYPAKMKAQLEDPRLKKVCVMVLDEARDVIKASDWQSFVNVAIADIQATFRRIKPMIIIINTQYVKDIDLKIRRTVKFYGECFRYRHKKAMMKLYKMWKDTRDIETPKLRKRKIRGFVIRNGKRILWRPKHLTFNRVDKESIEIYEESSYSAKKDLITRQLNLIQKHMTKEYGVAYTEVDAAVQHFSSDPRLYESILERRRGKIRLNKNVEKMLNFDKDQLVEFEKRLMVKINEKGYMRKETDTVQGDNDALAEQSATIEQ